MVFFWLVSEGCDAILAYNQDHQCKFSIISYNSDDAVSVVLVVDLGSEIVAHAPEVPDVVLHHQRNIGRHREGDLVTRTVNLNLTMSNQTE